MVDDSILFTPHNCSQYDTTSETNASLIGISLLMSHISSVLVAQQLGAESPYHHHHYELAPSLIIILDPALLHS